MIFAIDLSLFNVGGIVLINDKDNVYITNIRGERYNLLFSEDREDVDGGGKDEKNLISIFWQIIPPVFPSSSRLLSSQSTLTKNSA